jgi:hypothetical protein
VNESIPPIQIWVAECKSEKERDEVLQRCERTEGCKVIFVGMTDRRLRYAAIFSLIGDVCSLPISQILDQKEHPLGPFVAMIAGFNVKLVSSEDQSSTVKIKQIG